MRERGRGRFEDKASIVSSNHQSEMRRGKLQVERVRLSDPGGMQREV